MRNTIISLAIMAFASTVQASVLVQEYSKTGAFSVKPINTYTDNATHEFNLKSGTNKTLTFAVSGDTQSVLVLAEKGLSFSTVTIDGNVLITNSREITGQDAKRFIQIPLSGKKVSDYVISVAFMQSQNAKVQIMTSNKSRLPVEKGVISVGMGVQDFAVIPTTESFFDTGKIKATNPVAYNDQIDFSKDYDYQAKANLTSSFSPVSSFTVDGNFQKEFGFYVSSPGIVTIQANSTNAKIKLESQFGLNWIAQQVHKESQSTYTFNAKKAGIYKMRLLAEGKGVVDFMVQQAGDDKLRKSNAIEILVAQSSQSSVSNVINKDTKAIEVESY